jgi:hypothetical protein
MQLIRLSLLLCLSLISVIAWSQSKEEQQILQRLKDQEACWNKGDLDGYLEFYAPVDSVRMIYSKGVVYGRDSIQAFYKKYWPKERMGQLKMDEITIEILSEKDAFVSARFTVDFQNGKTTTGRFSGLMRKINSKWYLYTDHSG